MDKTVQLHYQLQINNLECTSGSSCNQGLEGYKDTTTLPLLHLDLLDRTEAYVSHTAARVHDQHAAHTPSPIQFTKYRPAPSSLAQLAVTVCHTQYPWMMDIARHLDRPVPVRQVCQT